MKSSYGMMFAASSALYCVFATAISHEECAGSECRGSDSVLLQHGRVFTKRVTCDTCADVFAGIADACQALADDDETKVTSIFSSNPELTNCDTMMGCGDKFRTRCIEVTGLQIVASQASKDEQGNVVCTEDCAARFKAEGGCDAANDKDWTRVETILKAANLSDCRRLVCGDSMVQSCSASTSDCDSCAEHFAENGGCAVLTASMQAGTMPSTDFTQYIPADCFSCSSETMAYCATYTSDGASSTDDDEETTTEEPAGNGRTEQACHTAVKGDPCYKHVQWAMEEGINSQPNLYAGSGLNSSSTWEEFQQWIYSKGYHNCPKPCAA